MFLQPSNGVATPSRPSAPYMLRVAKKAGPHKKK
jgi:hypothetical protein